MSDSKWLSDFISRRADRIEKLNILSAIVTGFRFWKHRNIMAEYSGNPEEFRRQMEMVKSNVPKLFVKKYERMNGDEISDLALDYNNGLNDVADRLCLLLDIDDEKEVLSLMNNIYEHISESDDTALVIFRTIDYVFMEGWIDSLIGINLGMYFQPIRYSVEGLVSFDAEPYMIRAELNTLFGVFNHKLKGDKLCRISGLEIPRAMKEAGFTLC